MYQRIFDLFESIDFKSINPEFWERLDAYLSSGRQSDLDAIPPQAVKGTAIYAFNKYGEGPNLTKELDRFWRVCAEKKWYQVFAKTVEFWNGNPPGDQERFQVVSEAMERLQMDRSAVIATFAQNCNLWDSDLTPTPIGREVAFADPSLLAEIFPDEQDHKQQLKGVSFAHFLFDHAPQNGVATLEILVRNQRQDNICTDAFCLATDHGELGLALAEKEFYRTSDPNRQFDIITKLAEHGRSAFQKKALELHRQRLFTEDGIGYTYSWELAARSAKWLIRNQGLESMADLETYFGTTVYRDDEYDYARRKRSESKIKVLDLALSHFGTDALPLMEAAVQVQQPDLNLHALAQAIALIPKIPEQKIVDLLNTLFQSNDSGAIPRAVRMAAKWNFELTEGGMWPLLNHKSKPVREVAASTLAQLGDSRLSHLTELWNARRADTCVATVSWLHKLGSKKAIKALQQQLKAEEHEAVRDAILVALESLGHPHTPSPQELKKRIALIADQAKASPAKWLKPSKLPPVKLKNGRKLPSEHLSYLLHRQSRIKEIRGDIESRGLLAKIDRNSSGDLAWQLIKTYFGAGAPADGKWTLALAALLGDDRLVPLLTDQVRELTESSRGKLAESAVQALGLLGSDRALLALDTMAIRYRVKYKNVGKAATDAFAMAAAERGISVEELGDQVVPWLGFEPHQPRMIDCGKRQVACRIDSSFALAFTDPDTGKRIANLPTSASATVTAEVKELKVLLKEATKSQLLRMETLMVRQFRWPQARWESLYLQHPLLTPFATRLVWGQFNKRGKLIQTFRALDDSSLTDANDESVRLKPNAEIGIVHPLELDDSQRNQWREHLIDYQVAPPFPQFERGIVRPTPKQTTTLVGQDFSETELNAMTFRGRAEKLSWMRGSVCEGGGIGYYLKAFTNAGVDVFLGIEGLFVGATMNDEVILTEVFFVKTGSVTIGNYEYDEPSDDNDPRLIPYPDVPPIVFSEAMNDLITISGKDPAETEKTAKAD